MELNNTREMIKIKIKIKPKSKPRSRITVLAGEHRGHHLAPPHVELRAVAVERGVGRVPVLQGVVVRHAQRVGPEPEHLGEVAPLPGQLCRIEEPTLNGNRESETKSRDVSRT